MEAITDHAEQTVVLQFGWCSGLRQPLARPDDHIVGQGAQQHHHLLRLKTLFAAFGAAQPLVVALEGSLDATPTLIVEGDVG